MIVEERIYTVQPGKVQEWLVFYGERGLPVQQRHLGRLIGFFTSEIGTLNQIVHLWAYDSLAHREEARAKLAKDPDWQAYLKQSPKVLERMENRILVPTAFSPLK
ncbi:MAG TPA: NIPSNAP family protein [Stellaceae bacterium]|nr:NIPSNAP family protein [Stellaceae bacterium]